MTKRLTSSLANWVSRWWRIVRKAKPSRWVEVAGSDGQRLLLARAATEQQSRAIGNQTGGRVGFFLYTDDFANAYADMRAKGVEFAEEPRHEAYGSVAVFTDVAGNRWDLIQPKESKT